MKCSSPVSANLPAHGGWLLFPVALFLACFLSSAIIPPFQSPDEFDHVKRAYLLTQGRIVLDSPEGHSSGGMIDTGLLAYMRSMAMFRSIRIENSRPTRSMRQNPFNGQGPGNSVQLRVLVIIFH